MSTYLTKEEIELGHQVGEKQSILSLATDELTGLRFDSKPYPGIPWQNSRLERIHELEKRIPKMRQEYFILLEKYNRVKSYHH
jgi:hypothetical protein